MLGIAEQAKGYKMGDTFDPETTLDERFNLCAIDPTVSRGKALPGFLELGATAGTTVKPTLPPKAPLC